LRITGKLYSGSKNHFKLYDAIEKQASQNENGYDESSLKSDLQGFRFTKQLHVTKNYLTRMILKSLRSFHSGSTVSFRLKGLQQNIEILFNKGLYKLCWKEIKKAEDLALKYDYWAVMLELLVWKRNLTLVQQGTNQGISEIERIVGQEKEALEKLTHLNELWRNSIDLISKNFAGRGQDFKGNIEGIKTETFQARRLYYFTRFTQNIFEGDQQQALDMTMKAVELIERYPHQIKEDPIGYVTAINNAIPVCFRLKMYDEIAQFIQKIKEVPLKYDLPNFEHLHYRLFLRTYNHELELYRDLGEIKKGVELSGEVMAFMERYDRILTQEYKILFHYQIAYFFFANSNYSHSLEHLNYILNDKETFRTDLQAYTRILNLMVHYELKNYDLIEYLAKSTQRYLNKRNRLYRFEKEILKFFYHVSKTNNQDAIFKLKQLKEKLMSIEEDQSEPLDFTNMLVWIQSKLNRTSFSNALSRTTLFTQPPN